MSDEAIETAAARYKANPCFQCEIVGGDTTVKMHSSRRRNEELLIAWAVAELERRKAIQREETRRE